MQLPTKAKIQRSEFEKLQRSFNVVKHRFNPPYMTSGNCLINLLQMEMQPARGQGCCRFQNIDSAMLEWFRMARSKNIPVSGSMLQAKAVAVAEQMQLENF